MNEITYKQIEEVNARLDQTDIKGKEYVMVKERIRAFRMLYPMGSIRTDIVSHEDGAYIIRAEVSDADGRLLGVGHACETEGSTNINKTSCLENCETSAVGRALGMLALGIDTSVASFDEVVNARISQIEGEKQYAKINDLQAKAVRNILAETKIDIGYIFEMYNVGAIEDLTYHKYMNLLEHIGQAKEECAKWRASQKK